MFEILNYITTVIPAWQHSVLTVYVSQSCGQVTVVQANITTSNAVIYIVDGFLGFIYNDLYTELMTQSDLS